MEEEVPAPIEDMLVEGEPPKSSEYREREAQLRTALHNAGYDWSITTKFPYTTVVEQFLNGKGVTSLLLMLYITNNLRSLHT